MKVSIKNPDQLLEYCRQNNIPFKLRQTIGSKHIICEFGEYTWYPKSAFKKSDLYFIKKVRLYCEGLKPVKLNEKSISYIRQGNIKKGTLKYELYEIDLSSAYWELAYKSKFISKDIYEEGQSVNKIVRLMALGNLAKRPTNFEFDGNSFVSIEKDEYPLTSGFFFDVSRQTDQIMKMLTILIGFNFLFYWVDAIFIQGEEKKNLIIEYLENNNIKYKLKPLYKIIKSSNKITVIEEKGEKKPRVFTFQKTKKIVSITKIDKNGELF